ncbi:MULTISPECIES: LacI family DNA-binding transcriptional regulator [Pseudonocardia]|uniref:HTH-type transcriptional repressor CytR n=2 Tax=Pseudonocardia TaxID=1847 RepID=A0A1Y2MUS6_PSEAH|nr:MULTISPECIES: LacI family DNA-binding transcriptional regulator [Pseudonocardia]OSY38934.1 HTH-type transcriptional repressor CytR [Pseudonocardia autotrophica]TDN76190.1 LacI family transcriptional regulator [Pseudonocardia autotrophica]BBG00171.1 LacI family transcriptional regulator [Pseudonocardia autotrophica]GEC26760.1 LacI family transcriptional regulator [Pseudonocardia saturnea]
MSDDRVGLREVSRPAGVRRIAELAGVSPATVSRALREGTPVSAGTRERVRRAALAVGYTLPVRSLTVAVLARFPTRWFFAEAVAGVEAVLSADGHVTQLHNVGDPVSRTHFFDTLPVRGRVDGLILVASALDDTERPALEDLGLPVTVVGGDMPGRFRVGVDDRAGARAAVRHLAGLGHEGVALVSFDPSDAGGRSTARDRRDGWADALGESAAAPGPVFEVGADVAAGETAAGRLLSLPRLPTAVFAMSDEAALGVVRTLRRAGVDVPGRVSVIGFDDHEMAAVADLTTIAQPVRRQGELAARALLATIAGESPADVELPTRLVVRGTTAPPR